MAQHPHAPDPQSDAQRFLHQAAGPIIPLADPHHLRDRTLRDDLDDDVDPEVDDAFDDAFADEPGMDTLAAAFAAECGIDEAEPTEDAEDEDAEDRVTPLAPFLASSRWLDRLMADAGAGAGESHTMRPSRPARSVRILAFPAGDHPAAGTTSPDPMTEPGERRDDVRRIDEIQGPRETRNTR